VNHLSKRRIYPRASLSRPVIGDSSPVSRSSFSSSPSSYLVSSPSLSFGSVWKQFDHFTFSPRRNKTVARETGRCFCSSPSTPHFTSSSFPSSSSHSHPDHPPKWSTVARQIEYDDKDDKDEKDKTKKGGQTQIIDNFQYKYLPINGQNITSTTVYVIALCRRRFTTVELDPEQIDHRWSPLLTVELNSSSSSSSSSASVSLYPRRPSHDNIENDYEGIPPPRKVYTWKNKSRLIPPPVWSPGTAETEERSLPPFLFTEGGDVRRFSPSLPRKTRTDENEKRRLRAILAFSCPDRARREAELQAERVEIQEPWVAFDYRVMDVSILVVDVKHVGTLMKLPVVVVLNSQCEIDTQKEHHDVALIRT